MNKPNSPKHGVEALPCDARQYERTLRELVIVTAATLVLLIVVAVVALLGYAGVDAGKVVSDEVLAVALLIVAVMLQLSSRRWRELRQQLRSGASAQHALSEAEELWQSLVQNSSEIILIVDATGEVVYVNRSLLGRTPEELLGRHLAQILPATQRPVLEEAIAAVFAEGQSRCVEIGGNGSVPTPVWFEVRLVPVKRRGSVVHVLMELRDISQRRAAEKALRESEERFRSLSACSPLGILLMDTAGQCLYSNPRGRILLGCTLMESLGEGWLQHLHPIDQQTLRQQWSKAVESRDEFSQTVRVLLPGRPLSWLHLRSSVMLGDDGQPLGRVVTLEDITARVQSEEAIRESEARYRSLVETARDVIFTLSADGRISSLNPAFETITGWKRSEWLQRSFEDLLDSADVPAARALLVRVLRGERIPLFVVRVRGPGGQMFLAEITVSPQYENGQVVGVLGIARDVTERHHIEERLRLQGAALESVANSIVITDRNGVVEWVNPAFTKLTGYSSEEVVGRTLRILQSGRHPRAFYEQLWQTILQGNVWQGEMVNRRKDGSLYTEEMVITPLQNAAGEITHFIAIKHDITERKAFEQALQQTNQRLEAALTELRQTQQQVIQQERLRAIGQMASGIAHDFNNTLAPIVAFTELLLHRPELLHNHAKVIHYLQMMHTAATDATNVVRRLREFYRPREETDAIGPVNLNQVVEQVISLTEPKWRDQALAANASIQIVTRLGDIPTIRGSEAALREMLTNLIFNAVDALPNGGCISLSTRAAGDRVILEVADTGVGMSEETRRRCFEPFYSTKGERGTGLGLATVHGIVRRHEATITVDSAPGKGTKFTISFPARTAAATASPPPQSEAGQRPLRILVVDDEAVLREAVSEYLTAAGYSVETAADGSQAWEKFSTSRFDLVITDQSMPGMTGTNLASRIKEASPSTPVILLTGFGDMMAATGDRLTTVDEVLSKPVAMTTIQHSIARLAA